MCSHAAPNRQSKGSPLLRERKKFTSFPGNCLSSSTVKRAPLPTMSGNDPAYDTSTGRTASVVMGHARRSRATCGRWRGWLRSCRTRSDRPPLPCDDRVNRTHGHHCRHEGLTRDMNSLVSAPMRTRGILGAVASPGPVTRRAIPRRAPGTSE